MSALAVEGELSIYRAAELKAALLGAVAAGDALELDLSKVNEMDSAGLQLVLLAAREARAAGKRFAIAARSPQVEEALQLCGLEGTAS